MRKQPDTHMFEIHKVYLSLIRIKTGRNITLFAGGFHATEKIIILLIQLKVPVLEAVGIEEG